MLSSIHPLILVTVSMGSLLLSVVSVMALFRVERTCDNFLWSLCCALVMFGFCGLLSYEWLSIRHIVPSLLLTFAVLALPGLFLCPQQIWKTLFLPYFILATAATALLCTIPSYSGGGWYGDWFEHYERALFFLDRLPFDFRFIDIYVLPARPPLASLITANFLAVVPAESNARFASYQLITCLLGCLLVFPVALFLRQHAQTPKTIFSGLLLLLLCPFVLQNLTFTWTRMLCNFFVLSAIYFYIKAFRVGTNPRDAWFCFGAAIVTHYSATIYLLVACWHHLANRSWRKALSTAWEIGTFIGICLVPWLLWSTLHFGVETTCCSNSTFLDSEYRSFTDNLSNMLANVSATLFPFYLLDSEYPQLQIHSFGLLLRELVFPLYQLNFPLMLGLSGFYVVLTQWVRIRRQPFLKYVLAIVFLGAALPGSIYLHGLAHIQLQPLALLCLVFIASSLPQLRVQERRMFIGLLMADIAIGLLPHLYWLSVLLENANQRLKDKHQLQFLADITSLRPTWSWLIHGFIVIALCWYVRDTQKNDAAARR